MKMIYFFLCLFITGCTLYNIDKRLLVEQKSPGDILVRIYYVGVGATANEVIQVCKVDQAGKEVLINAYEHNSVQGFEFLDGDTLKLALADSTMYGISKVAMVKVTLR